MDRAEKPTYEQLESRIAALERERLQQRAEILGLQLQLMDAALMNIAEKQPLAQQELAQIKAQLK